MMPTSRGGMANDGRARDHAKARTAGTAAGCPAGGRKSGRVAEGRPERGDTPTDACPGQGMPGAGAAASLSACAQGRIVLAHGAEAADVHAEAAATSSACAPLAWGATPRPAGD
eukprot:12594546-Alexandrium_andersonii.AAC.1